MKIKGSDKLHFRLENAMWALTPCTPQSNQSIQQLFGADDPSYLYPKEADFFYFPFRHLSKTIVGANTWKATDFSQGNVLKDSLDLLSGVTACKDHWTSDIVGVVGKAIWSDGYSTPDGMAIPAGIDAPFIIDSKKFADLVRDLNKPADLNPIQCASVAVEFEYEASHEFENEWMFERALGTMVNGEMVRRIVTKIVSYKESSILSGKGADKFARKLDENGKIEKMPYSEATTAEQDALFELYKASKEFYIFDKLPQRINIGYTEAPKQGQNEPNIVVDSLLARIAEFEAQENTLKSQIQTLEEGKANAEDLTVKLAAVTKDLDLSKAQSETLQKEKTTLQNLYADSQSKVASLQAKVLETEDKYNALQVWVKPTQALLTAKKEEVKRLYLIQVASQGKQSECRPDEKILAEIANADFEKADLLLKIYGGKVVDGFGAVCADCGSTKIGYKSSVVDDTEPKQKEEKKDFKKVYKG